MRASAPAIAASLLLLAPSAPAESAAPKASSAEKPGDKGKTLSEKDERKFREWSREVLKFVFPVRDEFAVLHPTFSASNPNTYGVSRQAMADQLVEVSVEQIVPQGGGFVVREKKKIFPNREDVDAACALRSAAPGEFGEVYAVRVRQALDRNEALVEDLRIYSGDSRSAWNSWREGGDNPKVGRLWRETRENQERLRRSDQAGYWNQDGRIYRLVGFPTKDMRAGETWNGPGGRRFKVAVGWTERMQVEIQGQKREIPVPVLVNAEKLTRPVDAKGFEDFLAKRGLSKADFVDMCTQAEEDNPHNSAKAKAAILWDLALLSAKAKSAPVAAVGTPAPTAAAPAPAPAPAAAPPKVAVAPQPGGSPPAPVSRGPSPVPEKPVGSPIFNVDDREKQEVPAPAPKPAPSTEKPAEKPAPAAPVFKAEKPRYERVPSNPTVDALVDLKKPDIVTKLLVGRWQADNAAQKPFSRVCAGDGTYKDFDAADQPVGGGDYQVTSKCAVVFIGQGKGELSQLSLGSPNDLGDGAGTVYHRMVPAK